MSIKRIASEKISTYEKILANREIVKKTKEFTKPLYKQIMRNQTGSNNMSATRSTLLFYLVLDELNKN